MPTITFLRLWPYLLSYIYSTA